MYDNITRSHTYGCWQVVHGNSSPEWNQSFEWAFDTPPKGQKLRISCKSKNTFGKVTKHSSLGMFLVFALFPQETICIVVKRHARKNNSFYKTYKIKD